MVSIAASADSPNATAMKRIAIAIIAAGAFIGEGIVVAELSDADATALVADKGVEVETT
jgi:hypothetical protein